jgi:integration host factor subunit beta
MTKTDLIEALRKETNLTKVQAEQVVELFFDEMSKALASGDRVEVRGLCSFQVRSYKGYTGRNPRTGEPREVPAKKLPFFKCGRELKERVDYK